MERHFAALSLPDPASDPKITRAISFSELPTSRRILIEQCYQTDDSGNLVRQYSCEQIFDKSSNAREVKVSEVVRSGSERCLTNTWKTTLPAFGILGNAGWHNGNYGRAIKAIEPSTSGRMESMEIEEIDVKPFKRPFARNKCKKLPIVELNGMSLSDDRTDAKPLIRASTFGMTSSGGGLPMAQSSIRSRSVSPKKNDTRANPSNPKISVETVENPEKNVSKPNRDDIKKNLRSLLPIETAKPTKSRCSCFKFVFFVMLSLTAVIVGIFINDAGRSENQREFDVTKIRDELNENVYGQKNAIDRLTNDLEKSRSGINLVAIVGGTGVGKSYAVGIVKKYFADVDRVFEFFSPVWKISEELFDDVSRWRCNLVILENLKQTDLRDVVYFVKFMRRRRKDVCVYAIAVFNPQKTDERLVKTLNLKESVDEIIGEFTENGMSDATVVGFETLDDEALDGCVRKIAEEKNIDLSDDALSDIREALKSTASGCKGAYARVQLLANS